MQLAIGPSAIDIAKSNAAFFQLQQQAQARRSTGAALDRSARISVTVVGST
jgi:hypothetical protein